jgi:F-type H+-transporting ATPase subunit delta
VKRSAHDYALALYQLVSDQPTKRRSLVAEFISVLEKERSRNLLPLIVTELERIEAEANHQVTAKVTTAMPLISAQQQRITSQLKAKFPDAKAVDLQETVDSTLLSGIRIQINGQTIDHTAQTKLSQLAARL